MSELYKKKVYGNYNCIIIVCVYAFYSTFYSKPVWENYTTLCSKALFFLFFQLKFNKSCRSNLFSHTIHPHSTPNPTNIYTRTHLEADTAVHVG